MISGQQEEVHQSGTSAGAGSFLCVDCSFPLSLEAADAMPTCPNCGGTRFRRGSMFEQPTLRNIAIGERIRAPADWLEELRGSLEDPGKYLVYWADGRARAIQLTDGWSRIGRSRSADIRLDDPTVSRRHAVIVQTPEGELRALDDRSLNGIFVNGEQMDWSPLVDGDELEVGRYTLHVVETTGTPAETA